MLTSKVGLSKSAFHSYLFGRRLKDLRPVSLFRSIDVDVQNRTTPNLTTTHADLLQSNRQQRSY